MARLWMVLAFVSAHASAWALVGGSQTQSFPSVFIWTSDGYALDETYCTASKVGPHVFLTAAHCVLAYEEIDEHSNLGHWSLSSEYEAGKKIRLSFARQIKDHTVIESAVIKKVYFHPLLERCLHGGASAYCRNSRTPIPDVVLVEIDLPHRKSQFSLAPSLVISRAPLRKKHGIIMIGYGYQDEGDEEPPTLKAAINIAVPPSELAALMRDTCSVSDGLPREDTFFGAPGVLISSNYANLGSGDSGGPVLDAASGMIIGVNSDGYCPVAKPQCERTTNSLFSRLDDFALGAPGEWLMRVLKAAR